ncbi:hypothetical protein DPEC_G00034400 [Dallia pectoralis]|uniref:Uncharacterized protein n=1 Tax=Dallia pectoralis TaxID=75939 RepID=A0ACC2HDU2_DALPE|nr:hypothetical protein DPEC_G00034400 [Dallia pectoralis]
MKWEEKQKAVFPDHKHALCNDPAVERPDFDKHFTVHSDASGVGIGAVLVQEDGDEWKTVAYVSRKLYPRETRYLVVELECLAENWALETLTGKLNTVPDFLSGHPDGEPPWGVM